MHTLSIKPWLIVSSAVFALALLCVRHGQASAGAASQRVLPPTDRSLERQAIAPLIGDEEAELSETEVLGVLAAANTAEITRGHLVALRLTDDALRRYASDAIIDYTRAQVQLRELAQRHALGPKESPLTVELRSRSAEIATTLEAGPSSAELDRRYAEAEAREQAERLELIDYALLPATRSAPLRAELLHARSATQAQLARAERLARQLAQPLRSAL